MSNINRKRNAAPVTDALLSLNATNASTKMAKKHLKELESINSSSYSMHSIHSFNPIIDVEVSTAPDIGIAEFLESYRDVIESYNITCNVEIELRFGTIISNITKKRFHSSKPTVNACILIDEEKLKSINGTFISGINHNTFEKYKKFIDNKISNELKSNNTNKITNHRIYQYKTKKRIIQDLDTNTFMTQTKNKIANINFFMPTCPFDVRIAIAYESPFEPYEESIDNMPPPENTRERKRVSAFTEDLSIELTEVKVLDQQNNKTETFEVELEVSESLLEEWLSSYDPREDAVNNLTCGINVASSLWAMVKRFMPNSGQAFKRDWQYIKDNNVSASLRQSYKRLCDKGNAFPGTMPVGFSRWHIPFIKSRDYFVSEKTDGVRYFLVINDGQAVFVDRSNNAYICSGLALLPLILPKGAVLDGEYVFNQREKRYYFMVFDILSTDAEESHVLKPFTERLSILNDFLSEGGPYRSGLRDGTVTTKSVIGMIRKVWFPAKHINQVFNQITRVKKADHSIARIYKDDKREHFTDGIVFSPGDSNYVFGTHNEYLKWKWADLITIDFLCYLSDNDQNNDFKLNVTCYGPKNTEIELDQIFIIEKESSDKIKKILLNEPNKKGIIEFSFNIETGTWEYKCMRSDKDRSNYIRTVLGSLMNIAEAISAEELQYRIAGNHSNRPDGWNEQLKNLRRNLLYHKLKKN